MPTSNANWLPTHIAIEQLASPEVVQAKTAAPQTSDLPEAIRSASSELTHGNYTLVTIGFVKDLNYPYVVGSPYVPAQILEFLPIVLMHPFVEEAGVKGVFVEMIKPFHPSYIDYIMAVAVVWFPSSQINKLQSLLLDRDSELYKNKDPTAFEIANLIDRDVLLNCFDGAGTSSESTPDKNGSVGFSNSLPSKSGNVIKIAAGSIAGSLAYLSLTVFMIRMFKKRNVKAMSTDSESLANSTSWLLGRSSASQNRPKLHISNPVNALNTLGWS